MNLIKKIKCLVGYHQYYCIFAITIYSRKVGCRDCSKQWGMNDDARALIRWSEELKKMYKNFGMRYK